MGNVTQYFASTVWIFCFVWSSLSSLRPGIQLSDPQPSVCSAAWSLWLSSAKRIVLRCKSLCNLKPYKFGKITVIVEKIIAKDFQRKDATVKVVISWKNPNRNPRNSTTRRAWGSAPLKEQQWPTLPYPMAVSPSASHTHLGAQSRYGYIKA